MGHPHGKSNFIADAIALLKYAQLKKPTRLGLTFHEIFNMGIINPIWPSGAVLLWIGGLKDSQSGANQVAFPFFFITQLLIYPLPQISP